jgi:hypothetical protein
MSIKLKIGKVENCIKTKETPFYTFIKVIKKNTIGYQNFSHEICQASNDYRHMNVS